MSNQKIIYYQLENLGCANCAAKMETKLNKLDEMKEATINFVNKKLTLEYKDDFDEQEVHSPKQLAKIKKLVTSIESDVLVLPWGDNAVIHEQSECSCTHDSCSVNDHSHEASGHNHSGHSHSHEFTVGHEHGQVGGAVKKGSVSNSKESTRTLGRLLLGTAISFSSILFDIPNPFGFIILIIGYLILGYEVLLKSVKNIRHGQVFDENFLMVIATLGALYTKEYPEAIMVMLLFQIGEYLQDLAVGKSRKQLEAVMNIKPEYANIQTESGIREVKPESVKVGDIIVVKPSEKVPLDGIVTEGSSFVDTSSLTGESVPRKTSIGDDILSGCINGSGTLFIEVTKTYSNSTVAKVLDLVENASSRKSNTETFITKFARVYTPLVVLAAVLLAVVPPIVTGTYDFNSWIYKACSLLVISCPCALVISIPLGFFGGIGCASKNGILVKGSNYLEALNYVETAVFDKTGTLTEGVFTVSEIKSSLAGNNSEELLEIAALVESFSTHPIARSIVKAYQNPLDTSRVSNYEEVAGHGVQALLDGKKVLIGNIKLLDKNGILHSVDKKEQLGTISHIAIDGNYAGYLVISDHIKKDSKTAIERLEKSGIQTVMLTGDTKQSGELVAKELGISKVYTELLPTDKVDQVESLISAKQEKGKVLFVGDGINDAPVLARADIGIAMGGVGSDAAIEAADIVIMNDEPSKISDAIQIAKHTKVIVTQNIVLSLGIKAIVLILVAFGYGSMWLAVFADVGVSLIAIVNSIRAMSFKQKA